MGLGAVCALGECVPGFSLCAWVQFVQVWAWDQFVRLLRDTDVNLPGSSCPASILDLWM